MKTVFASIYQNDALVLQSLLASAGIDSELLADRMLDVNPLFSTDIRGVELVVSDDQESDAMAIVEDFKQRKALSKGGKA